VGGQYGEGLKDARRPFAELEYACDLDGRPAREPDGSAEDEDNDHAKLAELAAAEPGEEGKVRQIKKTESEADAA
jgi:hypothetical protein